MRRVTGRRRAFVLRCGRNFQKESEKRALNATPARESPTRVSAQTCQGQLPDLTMPPGLGRLLFAYMHVVLRISLDRAWLKRKASQE